MIIAVIGGSGFIGTRLCARLERSKKEFIIIDKKNSHFYPEKTKIADIRDVNSLRKALYGVDVVINLAAEHKDNVSPKSLYDDVNVNGSQNIIQICEELNILKIIFTSSVAVYGFVTSETDESGRINYFNDYGRTKWEAEELYRIWNEKAASARMLTIIRPTVVFGERNRGNVYNLLRQIYSGFFPIIGNGKNIKSMAYVENVAAFLEYCIKYNTGYRIFNYIDKPDFNMNSLVLYVKKILNRKEETGIHWPYLLGILGGFLFDILAKISNKELPFSSVRIKKFCANTIFEAKNIKEIDFLPPISIEEGISKTVKYEFLEKQTEQDVLFYSE